LGAGFESDRTHYLPAAGRGGDDLLGAATAAGNLFRIALFFSSVVL